MSLPAPYVELHCHSAFSFLDGASTPTELAAAAAELGHPALALTDHDGIWGSLEFAHACHGLGVTPITGSELTIEVAEGNRAHITLLVENPAGYANLCRLLTRAHAQTRDGPQRTAGQPWVPIETLEQHSEGLICLSGCAGNGAVAGFWERGRRREAEHTALRLLNISGPDNFRIEIQRPFWRHDQSRNRWLSDLAARLGVPAVATGNVHSHSRERSHLQDALVAVRLGTTLEASEPGRRGNSASFLTDPATMARRFAEHPAAVAETVRIAERTRFDLIRDIGYRYPGSDDGDADRKLAEMCWVLIARRYESSTRKEEARGRLEQELGIIGRLNLSGFFLLHHDLLELAREVAIEVRGPDSARSVLPPGRGRGSSVSSIVCYLTGLSHVDPVEAELFGGRFLNDEVSSIPDIDLDFPRDIRERLIPRIHERYGHERSALVAAFPTYRSRSVIRELGKTLAIPTGEIEGVARSVDMYGGIDEIRQNIASGIGAKRASSARWRHLTALAREALGLPRHASQHSGGMVISTRPLIEICPVVPASMAGRQIVQWDKDSCADAGFLKIDLLGLGMLSAVERCVEEVRRTRGERLDLSRIPLDDRPTYDSIRRAETTGVFQIESRAQMQMLPRTLPQNLDDLTVQVALVRPGPIQGGAVHPYIERRRRLREDPSYQVPYEHPLLEPVLRETLGAIVFQEQVIEVAMALAGFSSSEAEGLRRAMSRKRSETAMRAQHERFLSGAMAKGVSRDTAERVFRKIQGFSGFGFPKAHSAAFGLLAYQSAWLRVHRGPEFLAALLNEQPMGFYPPDALVHEAQRRGIPVLPPDVIHSHLHSRVETTADGLMGVRIGLGYIKGAREAEMKALVAEREQHGPYAGVASLASRSGTGREGLERLAWAGVLDSLLTEAARSPAGAGSGEAPGAEPDEAPGRTPDRREALWQLGVTPGGRSVGGGTQLSLPFDLPEVPELKPMDRWETVIADYEMTTMSLGDHPISLLRAGLGEKVLKTSDLGSAKHGAEVELAGVVVARQKPETARGILFMLLEDEAGCVNVVIPPPVLEKYRPLARSAPMLRAVGTLERKQGVINVLAGSLHALEATVEQTTTVADLESARKRRREAVQELHAVAPAGHSFGGRGR